MPDADTFEQRVLRMCGLTAQSLLAMGPGVDRLAFYQEGVRQMAAAMRKELDDNWDLTPKEIIHE